MFKYEAFFKKLCHRELSCYVNITHFSTAAEISPETKMAGDGERHLENYFLVFCSFALRPIEL